MIRVIFFQLSQPLEVTISDLDEFKISYSAMFTREMKNEKLKLSVTSIDK